MLKNENQHQLWHAGMVDASILGIPNILDRRLLPQDGLPLFATSAKGAYLTDLVGNSVIDMICGFGSIILGHADDEVDEAVISAIRSGVSRTIRVPDQVALARRLCSLIPNADLVFPVKTGSDATSLAVRLARAATGRDIVLRWGYQGWHDWCAPRDLGIPAAVRQLTKVVPYDSYGDIEAFEREIDLYKQNLACLIMMPFEVEAPPQGFLEECRTLVHKAGGLFILDEVRSGFRVALGGAQQYYRVDADLCAFSKAIGNGYSIAAVTGPRQLFSPIGDISASSLYFRNADGFAAGIATLEALESRRVTDRLWQLGRQFQDGIARAAQLAGVPIRVTGLPVMPYHSFGLPREMELEMNSVFCIAAYRHGTLFHPDHHWFISDAMTPNTIAAAVDAATAGYKAVHRRMGELQ